MSAWLNLGAGRFPAPSPWVNVDIQPQYADIAGDVRALPFATDSASRIYAGHVAEHLYLGADLDDFLADLRRVLVPAGCLVLVIPDIDLGQAMVDSGQAPSSLITDIVDGKTYVENNEWERHKWPPRLDTLDAAVTRHFDDVKQVRELSDLTADGWPLVSEIGWQAAILVT